MKKVIGMLMVIFICILLGLSVRWGRERNVSLVSSFNIFEEADHA